jgi:hypothetical protein
MQKKFWSGLLVLVLSCSIFAVTAGAAELKAPKAHVCAVLIGQADLKTEDFINAMQDSFNGSENNTIVASGTEIQSKYQEYWLGKGELEEGKLTPAVMFDFVKYSGYDKCLFVVANNETEKSKKPGNFWSMVEVTRASVELKCFLADDKGVLKVIDVIKNDDSKHSDLRAKRGAFEKGIREVAKQLNDFLGVRY